MNLIANTNLIPPQGTYQAVCCDVLDLGIEETYQRDPQTGKTLTRRTRKVRIVWQIDCWNAILQMRHYVSRKFTLSLNEKAALRPFLEQWRGRGFTNDELYNSQGFDMETLIGSNCNLYVAHNKYNERVYANVENIEPCSPKQVRIEIRDYKRQIISRTKPPLEIQNELPF